MIFEFKFYKKSPTLNYNIREMESFEYTNEDYIGKAVDFIEFYVGF